MMRSVVCAVFIVCSVLAASGCSGDGVSARGDQQVAPSTGLRLFGYSAISCGFDDPHDEESKTDFADEVAGFTNANQICVSGDLDEMAQRLHDVPSGATAILYVEPVFFTFAGRRGTSGAVVEERWVLVRRAISKSGISPDDVVFYLVDEPTLRGLPLANVTAAATRIRRDYPRARTMIIEAYGGPTGLTIPAAITYWGFDAYGIRDPAAEPRYTSYLDHAAARLRPGQSLVLVMDATYTPAHRSAGLAEVDMADVARNYLALARSRTDVSIMLAYSWAGGIDNQSEKGVRDMDPTVAAAHREIGRAIVR
jgi:hypothetical protein